MQKRPPFGLGLGRLTANTLRLLYAVRDTEGTAAARQYWHKQLVQMMGYKGEKVAWWTPALRDLRENWLERDTDDATRESARERVLGLAELHLRRMEGRFVPLIPMNRVWERGSPHTNLPEVRDLLWRMTRLFAKGARPRKSDVARVYAALCVIDSTEK
jgi:hypothetical protein